MTLGFKAKLCEIQYGLFIKIANKKRHGQKSVPSVCICINNIRHIADVVLRESEKVYLKVNILGDYIKFKQIARS